jgi:ABC-type glycerol-3-phosphate transport system substrate-binding protein
MKRHKIARALALMMATLTMGSLVACGGVEPIDTDPSTLNVKIYKAGYGTKYIEKAAEEFNKTFADKGYSINVLAPREDLAGTNVLRDIYSTEEGKGVDVYFTANIAARTGVTGDFGHTLADMTESVYKKPAIKLDGTEETETIESKLSKFDFPSTHWPPVETTFPSADKPLITVGANALTVGIILAGTLTVTDLSVVPTCVVPL